MAEPTLAQLYNGIYGPADPSVPPMQAQQPVFSSPQLPTPDIQKLYEGIYGSATYDWAQQGYTPPSPPTPPVPMQAPPRLDGTGSMPGWGGLADLFAGGSRTRTEQAPPAPANGTGYQSGAVKTDNERLLPGLPYSSNIGQPPIERAVQSIPFTARGPAQNNVPLPRPRPNTTGVIATYPTTGLGNAFAPSVSAAQSGGPLRVVVNGGNYGSGRVAPVPAPRSQRPVTMAPAAAAPAPRPDAGTWAPSGYTNDGSGRITSNETGGVYYERHLR